MPRVRMVQHAVWRGQHFVPGAEVNMDPQTAEAYIRAGQAVALPDAPPAEAAAIAAKPAIDRPGPAVETAAAPRRERRRKKS